LYKSKTLTTEYFLKPSIESLISLKKRRIETIDAKEDILSISKKTANVRQEKADEFPNDDNLNQDAIKSKELYDYIFNLQEDHIIFRLYALDDFETEIDGINSEIINYAYENIKETPEEFVLKILKSITEIKKGYNPL
jgi:hypothetical protein